MDALKILGGRPVSQTEPTDAAFKPTEGGKPAQVTLPGTSRLKLKPGLLSLEYRFTRTVDDFSDFEGAATTELLVLNIT